MFFLFLLLFSQMEVLSGLKWQLYIIVVSSQGFVCDIDVSILILE